MGAGNTGGQDGRAGGLYGYDLDPGLLALQVLPYAGDGAAGAYTGHEDIHLAVGILIDLRAGGLKVGLGVGGIHELAGDEAAGDLGSQLVGLGNGTLHALGTLAEAQPCAVCLDELPTLYAHGVRHDDDQIVAPGGSHGGQADAGIAGGRLDEGGTGLQGPGLLGLVNNGPGDPVLYGAGGIEVLQLGQDPGFQLLFLLDMGQLQQGGLSNQLVSRGIDFRHHKNFLSNVHKIFFVSVCQEWQHRNTGWIMASGLRNLVFVRWLHYSA